MKSLLKREFLRLWHEKWIIWTVLLLSVFMMLFPDFCSLWLFLMCTLATCTAFRRRGEWKRLRSIYHANAQQVVAAKLIPAFCLCFGAWLLMFIASVVLLHIPMSFRGFCLLLLGTCIYILVALLLGLLISCISRRNTVMSLLTCIVLSALSLPFSDLLNLNWLTPVPMAAVAKEVIILCSIFVVNFLAVIGLTEKNLSGAASYDK